MSNLFKQLWPLIKAKVKDPNLLLKTINSIGGSKINELIESCDNEERTTED